MKVGIKVGMKYEWRVQWGTHLNPGNKGFREILQSVYVDKTGLIS